MVVMGLSVSAATVRGDDRLTLSGSWSASAVGESWAIGDWGEACGPKPRGSGGGGGAVQIKEMSGELSISGGGRGWSTGECWEQMPGLSRTSHSASGGGRFWRTRCSTAANDPRRATIVTTTSATDSSITMTETGQYQFVIHEQNCTASVTRTRSYSLVRREGGDAPAASASATPSAAPVASASVAPPPPPPPPSPPQAEAKPAVAKACSSPGDPARLEVFPSRKLLRPGDQFAFRATVFDDAGCSVTAKPQWSFPAGGLAGKASIDVNGLVTIASDAPEGRYELVASVGGGKGVTVTIEVASPEHYDALLATSDLNDAGESEQAAIATIATGTIGGHAAVSGDSAKERKQLFVAIVSFVAACLAIVGLAIARRSRNAERLSRSSRASTDVDALGGRNGSSRASVDAEPELQASAQPGDPQRASGSVERAGQAIGDRPAEPPSAAPPTSGGIVRGKICPTCGERYGADAEFCGQDGTTLVLIN
jgi:hypothetical protein